MTRKKVVGKRRRGLTSEVLKALLYPTLTSDDIVNNPHLKDHVFVFGSDMARHKAWLKFKSEIMAMPRREGIRPDAWWCYEAPEKPWFGERQEQALDRLGLLTEEEIEYFKGLGRWPIKPCPGPDWDPRDVLGS